jgi:hypothetical protein
MQIAKIILCRGEDFGNLDSVFECSNVAAEAVGDGVIKKAVMKIVCIFGCQHKQYFVSRKNYDKRLVF